MHCHFKLNRCRSTVPCDTLCGVTLPCCMAIPEVWTIMRRTSSAGHSKTRKIPAATLFGNSISLVITRPSGDGLGTKPCPDWVLLGPYHFSHFGKCRDFSLVTIPAEKYLMWCCSLKSTNPQSRTNDIRLPYTKPQTPISLNYSTWKFRREPYSSSSSASIVHCETDTWVSL